MARQLTGRLVAEFQPIRVLWFGSRANAKGRPNSDWDLLLVADSVESQFARMVRAQRVTADLQVAADILVFTPAEYERLRGWKSSVVWSAEQTGKVLHAVV